MRRLLLWHLGTYYASFREHSCCLALRSSLERTRKKRGVATAQGVAEAFPLLPLLSSKRNEPKGSREERRRRILDAQRVIGNDLRDERARRRELLQNGSAERESGRRRQGDSRVQSSKETHHRRRTSGGASGGKGQGGGSGKVKSRYKRSDEKKEALEVVCDYYTSLDQQSYPYRTRKSASRNTYSTSGAPATPKRKRSAPRATKGTSGSNAEAFTPEQAQKKRKKVSPRAPASRKRRPETDSTPSGEPKPPLQAIAALVPLPVAEESPAPTAAESAAPGVVPRAQEREIAPRHERSPDEAMAELDHDPFDDDVVMQAAEAEEWGAGERTTTPGRGRLSAGPRVLSPQDYSELGQRVQATKGRGSEVVNVSMVDLDTFLDQRKQKIDRNMDMDVDLFPAKMSSDRTVCPSASTTAEPDSWGDHRSDGYTWKESADSISTALFSAAASAHASAEPPRGELPSAYARTTVDADGVQCYSSSPSPVASIGSSGSSTSFSSSGDSASSGLLGASFSGSGGSVPSGVTPGSSGSRAFASPGSMISNRWNEIFQRCTQRLHDMNRAPGEPFQPPSLEDSVTVYEQLHSLAQNFAYTAATYGKVIIAEHNLPDHLKTVRMAQLGGQAGGKKFLVHDVVFKFAVDDKNIYENNDDLAMKVAGHELRALDNLINCHVDDLYFPLISIVDYRGFRLLAISCLPVDSFTLKVGSANGGRTIHNADLTLKSKMEEACRMLNLKPHKVGLAGSSEMELSGPIDLEGHLGKDGRYYLLDFSRLFPPDRVDSGKPNSYLYEHLRPEFVKQYEKPLCSDACSQFVARQPGAKEHKAEIGEAHNHLVNITIPGFVEILYSLHGRAADLFLSAPKHLVLSIHRQGINLRYLGVIRSLMIRKESNLDFCWTKLLLVEMIARVLKCKLRKVLREVSVAEEADQAQAKNLPSEVGYKREIVRFLNLHFGETQESKAIWCEEMPRAIMAKFQDSLTDEELEEDALLKSLFLPNGTEPNLGRCMLFRRLYEMCGFECNPAAVQHFSERPEAFHCPLPFNSIHVTEINVRVKHLTLLEHSSGMLLKLQSMQHVTSSTGSMAVHDDCTRRQLLLLSLECFERALECNPSNTDTLLECADTYHFLGIDGRARTLYALAADLNPNSGPIALRYARFLLSIEEADHAEDQLLRAWELGVQSPGDILIEYAELLAIFRKDLSGFHDLFDKALIVMDAQELRSRSAEIRTRYCTILTTCGRTTTSEALSWFADRYGAYVSL